jgi:DNA-binding protein HU-beta
VTKADLINQIADKTGIDKADVSASVEAFFNIVKSNMASGHNIYVRGFVPSFKPAKIFVSKIKNSDKVKQLAEK